MTPREVFILRYDCCLMIEDKKKRISLISQAEVTKLVETASSNSLIILDFDETLLLRNSTAEYLNSLRPRIIGLLLLNFYIFCVLGVGFLNLLKE